MLYAYKFGNLAVLRPEGIPLSAGFYIKFGFCRK